MSADGEQDAVNRPSETGAIERLRTLGLELPASAAPAANYVPHKLSGDLLFISGQLAFRQGVLAVTGKVGGEVSLDEAYGQARVATLNALAAAHDATGTLEGLSVAHLQVFVASEPSFTDQHLVANGASDLLTAVLGNRGSHPRTAIATPCLPLDAPVEVQVIFQTGPEE
jgi:enamine deaminase RidA (YjgF/YER057c/UK114 family)